LSDGRSRLEAGRKGALENLKVRQAGPADAKAIHDLIIANRAGGQLMRLPLPRIEANIHEFIVAEKDGDLVGCCALHSHARGIWEAASLSVRADLQRGGIGTALMRGILARASPEDQVYAGTDKPDFGARFGFRVVETRSLPPIIWLHKARTMLEQDLADWPRIIRKKYTFMRLCGADGNK